jgi:TolB-like protein/Tfp pilus assembly protein PilF
MYETWEQAPWHRRPVFLAPAFVVLLAFLVVGWYWRSTPTVRQPQIRSLAVLPFENGSDDANLNYLSDGLSESLIDKLSQLRQLKVTARTSSFKFRGANPDLHEIAAKLGVQAVMTGRVIKIGDQLNVRVELVDTSEDTQIWGDQFIRPYAQVTNIQREIAQIVSDKLRLKLTGAQEAQLSELGTDNPKAYELYMKAKHLINVNSSAENRSAVRLLQQAVEADPNFARAWAGLADLNFALVGIGALPREQGERTAEAALKKTLELDPDLPVAHLILASSKVRSYKWHEAEAEYKRVIELDPNNSGGHTGYGIYLSIIGHHDQAIREGKLALELDPLSHRAAHRLALSYYFARRFDDVFATSRTGLEITPDYGGFYEVMGYCHVIQQQYAEAIESFNKAIALGDDSSSTEIFLAWAFADAGQTDKAEKIINKYLSGEKHFWPSDMALVQASLGDKDAAIASLENAYTDHDYQIKWIKVDPAYDPLRSDPRFIDLVRRVFPE